MARLSLFFRILLLTLVLYGCVPATSTLTALPAHSPATTVAVLIQPRVEATPLPSVSIPSSPAPTVSPVSVCSPFPDYDYTKLKAAIVNPYHPPPPGRDDPHEGIDLAVIQSGTSIALPGGPVQAVLSGKAAAVIRNRFPYGNAAIVETPLDSLPELEAALNAAIPTAGPRLTPLAALTCPPAAPQPLDPIRRSLYLVYAHLRDPLTLTPGEQVACGQSLGTIGQTGNALNPHLHFEVRVGPSGARFASLAHYDSSASPAEMSAYCEWRVSGLFQLLDPLGVLSFLPGPKP
jgi:murein DD-endopeptidase MepM/ murein hydrolase activator NlpD